MGKRCGKTESALCYVGVTDEEFTPSDNYLGWSDIRDLLRTLTAAPQFCRCRTGCPAGGAPPHGGAGVDIIVLDSRGASLNSIWRASSVITSFDTRICLVYSGAI